MVSEDLSQNMIETKKEKMFDFLSEELNKELQDKFKTPCEDMFTYLAQNKPEALLQIIDFGKLKETDLTFALEVAGSIKSLEALETISDFLDLSISSLLLEGAIIGVRKWVATNIPLPERKAKCLHCDWKGNYEEAKFETVCGDGCCQDYICPKCDSGVVDENYNS